MIKVLFVCHGNICRSPMAEFVMKDLVKKAGLEKEFRIAPAATSTEEIGNPVYPPARRKLAEHGVQCDGHSARQLTNRDYDQYDLLIGMDQANLRNVRRIISAPRASLRSVALRNGACGRSCGRDCAGKMHLLLDFIDRQKGPQQSQILCWGEEKQGSSRSFRHRRKRRKADFASTK